ncbi:MAG TPA: SDR family NAD(P)-dependent oxidoreductase, partial [Polyangiaceae bacterium]
MTSSSTVRSPRAPAAFVTGADHGLGRAFVEKFLGEGFRVFAGCHRLERDGASARDHGSELTEVPLDVRSAA